MNTEFIVERKNPDNYARIIDRDFREMTDGLVSEQDAVSFITTILTEAKPCKYNSELWFWMFEEPSNMPSDCRIDYVYETTYKLSGIIIYALTKYETVKNIPGVLEVLHKTLTGSMGRDFMGHGFERYDAYVTAMAIFARSNINAFFDLFSDDFIEFKEFFRARIPLLEELANDEVIGDWGESYSDQATAVLELLSHKYCPIRVFVYGTLMQHQSAHHYLENARYINDFILKEYSMYDLGSFPGVLRWGKDQNVIGEVYEITSEMIPFMDRYEGEGSLYNRQEECVINSDEKLFAYVYVYNGEPNGRIVKGKWGNTR